VFLRSIHVVTWAVTLGALLLSSLADPLIRILYGDTWLPAVEALRWLAVLGGMRVVLDLAYDLFVAVGRVGTLFVLQAVWLVSLLVGLPIGAHLGGIGGVAVAHVVIIVAVVVPTNLLALRAAGVRVGGLPQTVAGPFIAAIDAVAVIAALSLLDLAPWPRLLLSGAAGGLVYLAATAAQTDHRNRLISVLRPRAAA
jgi:PST family polysaccharide transporter